MELFDWMHRLKDSIRWLAVGVVSLTIDTAAVSFLIKAIRFLRTGLSLVSCIKHVIVHHQPHKLFIHSFIHPFIHPLHNSHLAPPLQNRHRALRNVLELDLRMRLIMQRAATSHSLQTRTSAHLDLLQRHEVSIVQLQGPQRRVVPKQKTLRLLKRSRSQLDILQARTV